MSKIEVDAITEQSGTTLTTGGGAGKTVVVDATTVTLGRCGGTVALASGATQSGFGRTGTVDWQTGSIKTTTFTGENGKGYFVDVSSGVVTANLPASPTAGDIMAVSDYAQNADNNNITVGRNGSNIQGSAADLVVQRKGVAMTLVFVDATKGWVVTDTGAEADKAAEPEYVTATGGTITTVCTNFKVHTFTGPGTFCVSAAGNPVGSNSVDYLVIGAGGAGGNSNANWFGTGGGGAGGYRFSNGTASGCYSAGPSPLGAPALPVSTQGYPITVGSGGANGGSNNRGGDGNTAVFSTITSTGGGGGGSRDNTPVRPGANGGSGGGAASGGTGGSGNTPSVSPSQGFDGGTGNTASPHYGGGGGGGASVAGTNGTGPQGGPGGNGLASTINGTPTTRGGGGGAGVGQANACTGKEGSGGSGGGGAGGPSQNTSPGVGVAGTANTGGGGGGSSCGPSESHPAGAGGSGIVIIRYKFQN